MAKASVNGTELHFDVIGEGKPLLMIHGLASSMEDWQLQIPTLKKQHQLILVDLRGHGKTGAAMDYSIPVMADDLHHLLESLKIEACNVMGISMGGMVAMALAAKYPVRVDQLILVNTATSLHHTTLPYRTLLKFRRLMPLIPMPTLAKIMVHSLLPGDHLHPVREVLWQRWQQNDPQLLSNCLDSLIATDLSLWLPDISAETLFIRGDRDFFSLSSAMACCNAIPEARLHTIKDSGHGSPADQMVAFNEAVEQFLSR